ncbi:hypothetical protein ACOMHN_002682 [Nucella lapillus]
MVIEEGALVVIEEGGLMVIEEGGLLDIEEGGLVVIEEGGLMVIEEAWWSLRREAWWSLRSLVVIEEALWWVQVEQSVMVAVHRHLPHFLPQLPGPLATRCLPLLAHTMGRFIGHSAVCRALVSSFHTLCQCTKKSFASMASDASDSDLCDRDMSLKCVYFTIRELTAVIALKSLDVALLQKVLTCYLVVCESLQPETHIPLLLQGVCARLSDSGFPVDCVEGGLDVPLCWHRPQLPPGFGQHHAAPQDQDSLDHVSLTEESESDTSLNRSGSSLGLQMYSRTGRRRTLSTTDDILEIREVTARLSPRGKTEGQTEEEEGEEEEEEEEGGGGGERLGQLERG